MTSAFSKSSVFPVHTYPLGFHSGEGFRKFAFRCPYSSDTCGRKANPQRKVCVFKSVRLRVDAGQLCSCRRTDCFGVVWTPPSSKQTGMALMAGMDCTVCFLSGSVWPHAGIYPLCSYAVCTGLQQTVAEQSIQHDWKTTAPLGPK